MATHRNFLIGLLIAGSFAFGASETAMAETSKHRIVGFSDSLVSIYPNPERSEPTLQVARSEIKLPVPVLQEEGDYGLVDIGGKRGWVSLLKVNVERGNAPCPPSEMKTIAASRGASEGCRR